MSWDYDEDLVKCNFCGKSCCCITCAKRDKWKYSPIPKVKRQKKPSKLGYICPSCLKKLKPKAIVDIPV